MSKPAPGEDALGVGIVLSARSDRRLLRASLQSIERLSSPPDLVIVVLPRGREHLFDQGELAGSHLPVRVLVSEAADDSWLTVGFRELAPAVDVAIFASEGTIFETEYVQAIQDRYTTWQDIVGLLEIVPRVVKVPTGTDLSDIRVVSQMHEGALHTMLRRWLRARSLMPCILTLRMAACRQLRFTTFSAFCDWMSYTLFLNRLRPRGRTAVEFAERAHELHVSAERRSGFDFGYAIYDRLTRIGDYTDMTTSPRPSYLNPRVEKMKLFAEQTLQLFLSPRSKRHIVTVIQGMLAARRKSKATMRSVQREIRDLA
jgi:hypothetical protein